MTDELLALYEDGIGKFVTGADFFIKLGEMQARRANAYADILKREVRAGRFLLGSDDKDTLLKLEFAAAEKQIQEGEEALDTLRAGACLISQAAALKVMLDMDPKTVHTN